MHLLAGAAAASFMGYGVVWQKKVANCTPVPESLVDLNFLSRGS